MASIAIFSTYAPSEGFGGPARTFHQRRVLEAAGHRVDHVVVQGDAQRGDTRSTDLILLCERPRRALVDHIYADVDLARRASRDGALVERVARYLEQRETQIVILEQPFLVQLVEQALESVDATVVYSCQNIEYRLRRDLERFDPNRRPEDSRAEEVRAIEHRAVELSSAVTAICPTDQDLLREEFGCESIIVPNGTSIAELPIGARRGGLEPTFVFAGSSYWPNIEGFVEVATPSLAFLPPTARIHIAGTVGREINVHPNIRRWESANLSRIVELGFLPMDELATLMRWSTAVLVPVFIGEGSNLKSADALASGAPVVMTERATRGYEDVLEADASGVTVVSDPMAFRTAMLEAIAAADGEAGRAGRRRTDLLDWSRRLTPLTELIGDLSS